MLILFVGRNLATKKKLAVIKKIRNMKFCLKNSFNQYHILQKLKNLRDKENG